MRRWTALSLVWVMIVSMCGAGLRDRSGGVAVADEPAGTAALTVTAPDGACVWLAEYCGGRLYIAVSEDESSLADTIYEVDMGEGTLTPVLEQTEHVINAFLPLEDGSLWVQFYDTAPDEVYGVTTLLRVDRDGNTLASCDLTEVDAVFDGMFPGEDGGVNIILRKDRNTVVTAVDGGGTVTGHTELAAGRRYTAPVALEGGGAAAAWSVTDNHMNLVESGITVFSDGGASDVPLPEDAGLGEFAYLLCGDGSTIWVASVDRVYAYDRAAGTLTERFNWLDMGVEQSCGTFLRDGRLWTAAREGGDSSSLKVFALPLDSDKRRTLTMAAVCMDDTTRQAVLDFNRENPDYQVQVKEYIDMADFDPEAAWSKLSYELIAGDVPDLFDVSETMGHRADLIRQGLLADLTPWLDGDQDLREDILPSLLNVCTDADGALYTLAPAFSVSVLAGRAGDVETAGMTKELFAQMAEEDEPLMMSWGTGGPDRAFLFQSLLQARLDEFVDFQALTCDFDTQAFLDLMDLAKTVPCALQATYDPETDEYPARLEEVPLFCYDGAADSFAYGLWRDGVFCGWPGADGPVGYIVPRGEAAMSAQTDCPEGCWAFLRFLLENYGEDTYFAALGSSREAQAAQAMEDGVDRKAIRAVDGLLDWDLHRVTALETEMLELAYDAALGYYEGETTAGEAAADLQSRARIILAEKG